MRTLTLCLLLLATPALLAQGNPEVNILRVAPPAKLLTGKKSAALLPSKVLVPGNRISTGIGGRAALQISGGVLTLGGDSELYLHSSAEGESADIARLVLARGALRVQVSRDQNLPPLDLRLNVGPLRLRAVAANLWTASEPRGETVCLLAGAVEIAAEFGTEKLDRPGDCLFFSAQNRRLVLKPDSAETLARKLERTAFASDLNSGRVSDDVAAGPQAQNAVTDAVQELPVAVTESAVAPSENTFVIVEAPPAPPLPEPEAVAVPPIAPPPAAPVIELAPTPEFSAPPPVESAVELVESAPAAAVPAPPAQTGGWLVVVASPGSVSSAQAYADQLRAAGFAAAVRSGNGRHRVVVGPYASREAAAAERAQLQYRLKVNGAWLLQD